MEYVKGALAILFIPFFIGAMLLAIFWEKDSEGVEKQGRPRERGQQSPIPSSEVEKQPSPAPKDIIPGTTGRGGDSPGNQQTDKKRRDDERRRRKRRRR
jgi:hypothetical protein